MISYLDLRQVNARYDDEIRNAVSRVLDSGWYLRGEATRRFEQHYADYIGTRYCVGCANGLDALTLIFRAYIDMGVMEEGRGHRACQYLYREHPLYHRKPPPTDTRGA